MSDAEKLTEDAINIYGDYLHNPDHLKVLLALAQRRPKNSHQIELLVTAIGLAEGAASFIHFHDQAEKSTWDTRH